MFGTKCRGYNHSRIWCLSQLLRLKPPSQTTSQVLGLLSTLVSLSDSSPEFAKAVTTTSTVFVMCAVTSINTANMVACPIIGIKFDYCNSMFSGMSQANLNRLQQVQKSLAWVVAGTHWCDHIKPVFATLHWLPIKARVTFKNATMVFKIRQTHQTSYLSYLADMIEEYQP